MKKLTRSKLKKWIREEVSNLSRNPEKLTDREPMVFNEDFSRSERRELAKIIRNELARLFYDLYRKRSFWKK